MDGGVCLSGHRPIGLIEPQMHLTLFTRIRNLLIGQIILNILLINGPPPHQHNPLQHLIIEGKPEDTPLGIGDDVKVIDFVVGLALGAGPVLDFAQGTVGDLGEGGVALGKGFVVGGWGERGGGEVGGGGGGGVHRVSRLHGNV